MQKLDIAIAGCGPAGLAAALLLHQSGHSVTIFERFEEPRPIGSGLMIQPTGLAVLARLGLAEDIIRRGARIDALKGMQENGRIALDARYSELGIADAFGVGIHRASLFGTLLTATLARGIALKTSCEIIGTKVSHTHRYLEFSDETISDPFDLVVDASGWQSSLDPAPKHILPYGALWANLPLQPHDPFNNNLLEQRYRRAAKMVGALPIGTRKERAPSEVAFFWSLKHTDYPAWREQPLKSWKSEVVELWPETSVLMDRIETREQLTFARYSHRTASQPIRHRLISIGDAWHSASPQLGQGANMALLDAYALYRGLQEGRTLDEGLRLANAWRSDHVALYQWITAIFTPLYQSDGAMLPLLRDRILAPLSRLWPISRIQASLMSGLFGAPLAQLKLEPPNYSAIASSIAARASSLSQ